MTVLMTVGILIIIPRSVELPVLGGGWVRLAGHRYCCPSVGRTGGSGLTSIRLSAGQGHGGESEEQMEGAALWRGP